MENQVSVSDQNTQQIGQNLANQQVQSPEKPKINYLMISLVILICFVVFGFGGLYFGQQSSKSQKSLITNSFNPSPTSQILDMETDWKTYPSNTTIGLQYSFRYPNTVDVSEAQDLVYLRKGNVELFHRFIGKTKDITSLMSNFQPFAAPKLPLLLKFQ